MVRVPLPLLRVANHLVCDYFFCLRGTRTTGSDNPSSEGRAVLARAMPSRDGLKTSEAQSIPLPLLRDANHLVCDFSFVLGGGQFKLPRTVGASRYGLSFFFVPCGCELRGGVECVLGRFCGEFQSILAAA